MPIKSDLMNILHDTASFSETAKRLGCSRQYVQQTAKRLDPGFNIKQLKEQKLRQQILELYNLGLVSIPEVCDRLALNPNQVLRVAGDLPLLRQSDNSTHISNDLSRLLMLKGESNYRDSMMGQTYNSWSVLQRVWKTWAGDYIATPIYSHQYTPPMYLCLCQWCNRTSIVDKRNLIHNRSQRCRSCSAKLREEKFSNCK